MIKKLLTNRLFGFALIVVGAAGMLSSISFIQTPTTEIIFSSVIMICGFIICLVLP